MIIFCDRYIDTVCSSKPKKFTLRKIPGPTGNHETNQPRTESFVNKDNHHSQHGQAVYPRLYSWGPEEHQKRYFPWNELLELFKEISVDFLKSSRRNFLEELLEELAHMHI